MEIMRGKVSELILQYNSRIVELFEKGDINSALQYAKTLVQRLETEVGVTHPDYCISLINLASISMQSGDNDKTKSYFIEALKNGKDALGDDDPYYITAVNNYAAFCYELGEFEKAESLMEEALAARRVILGAEHPYYATSLDSLAAIYREVGKYQRAESLMLEAKSILEKSENLSQNDYAICLDNLGNLYRDMGLFEKAEPLILQALAIIKNNYGENTPDYNICLNNLGLLYQAMGFYDQAEPLLKQSSEYRKIVMGKNHPSYAVSLNGLGLLYQEMGSFSKAESYLTEAAEIQKNQLGESHFEYIASLNNLGALYWKMGDIKKAESFLTKGLSLINVSGRAYHPINAGIHNSLANFYASIGEYDIAEPLYKKALEILKVRFGELNPDYSVCLNNIAEIYHNKGQYKKAEPLLLETVEIRKKIFGEFHPKYLVAFDNLASFKITTGRVQEGFLMKREVGHNIDKLIDRIFSITSEDQKIAYISTWKSHLDSFISLVFQHCPENKDAINDAFSYVLRRKAIVAEFLATQRDEILGGKYPHLQDKLILLKQIRMEIAQTILAGPWQDNAEAYNKKVAKLTQKKEQLEEDLSAQIPELNLIQKIRNSDNRVIACCLPPNSALIEFIRYSPLNYSAIPSRGDEKWGKERYCAFILNSDEEIDIKLIDLGEASQIDQLIQNYKSKITKEGRGVASINQDDNLIPSRDLFSKYLFKKDTLSQSFDNTTHHEIKDEHIDSGNKLYENLIQPLVESISKHSTLIISPDGQLNIIPFEVIPLPEGGYLIDQYQISYVSSGRDILRFKIYLPEKMNTPLIMAAPDYNLLLKKGLSSIFNASWRKSRDIHRSSLYFSPLPGTKIEGEQVGNLLRCVPLVGEYALEKRLKSVRSPSIIHIATHGFFLKDQDIDIKTVQRNFGYFVNEKRRFTDIENPMLRSGLALAGANSWLKNKDLPPDAEDGILTAEDVTGLDLTNTNMVVLSACETGIGEIKNGEGVYGLRRSFILAGARTLIMSMWKVPDIPTQLLMKEFYERIRSGMPKSEALRQAQIKIREQFPHPGSWGAFICQGDPGIYSA